MSMAVSTQGAAGGRALELARDYQIKPDGVPFYHAWAETVPTRLSRRFRIMLLAVLALTAFGIVWAITVPISGAFLAEGRLIAQGRNRIVDHLEGGIVQTVLVHEGDAVKAGDLMARMDVTNASVNLVSTRRQRDIDRIQLTRLLAEQTSSAEIKWPDDLAVLVKQDKELAEAAATQREEFETKQRELASTRQILDERINTNTQLVESLTALRDERDRRLADIQNEVAVSDDMMNKGLTTRDRNYSLKRQLASDQDQMRQTLIQIDDKRSAINEAREQLNRVLSQRSNEVADQALKLQAEIYELTEKMRAYEAQVGRAEVRAPIDGVVTTVAVNTQNQVIGAGKPIFEILPKSLPLAVEAKVDPRYIDSVVPGQHVMVQFQSRERTRSRLMIEGHVNFVSSDSDQDQKTGRYYYTVRAELDPASVKTYGEVVPGNIGEVYFQLDKQTFFQYLIDPYWDMGQKAFVG